MILNGWALTHGNFGFDVAPGSDLNGDGNDRDILIGAPAHSAAYVFYGSNWPSETMLNVTDGDMDVGLYGSSSESNGDGISTYGFSVANAGDVYNDNYPDIIVGAPGFGNYSGAVYLYQNNGSMKATFSTEDISNLFYGDAEGDKLGHSVSGFDMFNNDPYDDIIVGAPGFGMGNSGKTYVLGRLAPLLSFWIAGAFHFVILPR